MRRILKPWLYLHVHSVDSCLRNAPPVDQWDGKTLSDLRVAADRGEISTLTAVMSDYVFHCNGTISQWRLQWYLRPDSYEECTVTFTFYTLRPEAGNDCILTPVGSNTMTLRTDDGFPFRSPRVMESIFNISVEDKITVQAGDIVGLRVEFDRYCNNDTFWLAGMRSTKNSVYYETFETDDDDMSSQARSDDETSSQTRYDDKTSSRTRSDDDTSSPTRSDYKVSSRTRFLGNIDVCRFYQRKESSPFITAVVGKKGIKFHT